MISVEAVLKIPGSIRENKRLKAGENGGGKKEKINEEHSKYSCGLYLTSLVGEIDGCMGMCKHWIFITLAESCVLAAGDRVCICTSSLIGLSVSATGAYVVYLLVKRLIRDRVGGQIGQG